AERQNLPEVSLRRCRPRLQQRYRPELQPGGRRRGLAAHARLVWEVSKGLTARPVARLLKGVIFLFVFVVFRSTSEKRRTQRFFLSGMDPVRVRPRSSASYYPLSTRQLAPIRLKSGVVPQRRQQKRVDLAIVQHRADIGHTRAGAWVA